MKKLLPALLLVTTAAAQPWLYAGPVEQRAWPGATAPNGKATGSTVGHFLGAGYPDVVILRDAVPHLYASPGALNCLESTPIASAPTGCTAVATLFAKRATSGRRTDQLLVSHPGGLSAWKNNSSAMTWLLLDARFEWSSVRKLVVADLNADGFEDLVAISSDGTRVMVRLGTVGGLGAGPSFEFLCVLPSPILDVTTTLWDAGSTREIAVATTAGLWILADDLHVVTSVPGTAATNAFVASVRRPGGELLILSAVDSAGTWWLHGIDPLNPSSVSLGNRDLVASAVGDANLDGIDDVVFSQRSSHRALLMLQLPGAVPFSMFAALEIPFLDSTLPAPQNHAVPVFADLDGDGDADLVHPVTSSQSIVVVRSASGSGRAIGLVSVIGDATNMWGGTREFLALGQQQPFRDLQVNLALSTNAAFPAAATNIEVAVWRLQSDSLHSTLSSAAALSLTRLPRNAQSATLAIAHSTEIDLESSGELLVQLRPIRVVSVDGQSVIERTYPASTYILASDDWRPTLTAMRLLPQVIPNSEIALHHEFEAFIPGGDTNGGIGSGGTVGVEPPPPTLPPGGGAPVGPG